ncbi:MAG TPA: hypothetical protein VF791_04955 [Pyrinomonadaceae bacterium]
MGKKRIEITVETERVLVIKCRGSNPVLWCEGCAKEVAMLTVDEAAIAARVSSRLIFQLAEAGRLHFVETPEGRLYICPDSLA